MLTKERLIELNDLVQEDLDLIEDAIKHMDHDRDNGIMAVIRDERRRYFADVLELVKDALKSSALETTPVPEPWLIRKRGYYYRPNRAGYTGNVNEAGRYTEEEAKAEAAIEPAIMDAIPLSKAASKNNPRLRDPSIPMEHYYTCGKCGVNYPGPNGFHTCADSK